VLEKRWVNLHSNGGKAYKIENKFFLLASGSAYKDNLARDGHIPIPGCPVMTTPPPEFFDQDSIALNAEMYLS
jgi:hypothetical protein